MTRHFYKHRVTGVVGPLNDSFAAVFGDRFERVGDASTDATVTTNPETPVVDAPREIAQEPAPVTAEAAIENAAPSTIPADFSPETVTDDNTATTADAPKEASK